MKFVVVGCGTVGSTIAHLLARNGITKSILLVDKNKKNLDLVEEKLFRMGNNMSTDKILINCNSNEIKKINASKCIIVNAASPECNIPLMMFCLENSCNYIDLASNPFEYPGVSKDTTLDSQLKLNSQFIQKGLLAVTNTGFSPGFTDILCRYLVDKYHLKKISSIEIFFGEKIVADSLTCSWSPYTLLLETLSPPTILKDGKIQELGKFETIKVVDFGNPLGKIKVRVFSGHPELRTIPEFLEIPVNEIIVGGGMFLNKLDLSDMIIAALNDVTESNININGDILEILSKKFNNPENFFTDFKEGKIKEELFTGLVKISAETRDNQLNFSVNITKDIKEIIKNGFECSVASYVVAFIPTAIAILLASGKIRQTGVIAPAKMDGSQKIISMIKSMGLNFRIKVKKG